MRRPLIIAAILAGVVIFLGLSALLARALSVGGAEDSALTQLVRDEAQGNRSALVDEVTGCRRIPACQARAQANIAALRRPGGVQIIQIQPSAGFSLGSTVGTARVAWLVGGSLPRVQCVRVRRAGDVLSGFQVQLLEVSLRIHSDADCPSRY
jgi:hypothetical protein